jgi:glycosyltransferase involved in cell wall biosynthesis
MTDQPLVSVIVPMFNCERFVAEALDSVLGQDYPNVEVIAIDDGSTDGTTAIVERYAPRVRLLRQQNLGPAAARNRGVRESSGKYLAFLDGDDVWLPRKLAAQVEHAESHPEHPIVFAQFKHWVPNADGSYPRAAEVVARYQWSRPRPLSGWLYADLLKDTPVHIITALVRRDAFEALGGFDESLRAGSDYDFWLKATYRFQAHQVLIPGALYRQNGAGITSTAKPVNYGYLILTRALERFGPVGPDGRGLSETELQARLATMCFSFGRVHYRKGDLRLARDAFLRSFKHSSSNLRALAYWALSSVRAPFPRRGERPRGSEVLDRREVP